MDLDYFEGILRGIEYKPEKIRSIAEYCCTNNVGNEYEVARIVEKHFNSSTSPSIKAAIFFVLAEIMSISYQKNIQFFKVLATKIKSLLEELSTCIVENDHALAITSVVNKWSEDMIFKPVYMEKLKTISQPLYFKVQEEKQSMRSKFSKYKKTTLMEMLDVDKFEPTKKIYASYRQVTDMNYKLGGFNVAYAKLESEAEHGITEETIARCKELNKAAEGYRQKLEQLIEDYHEQFKLLREYAIDEYTKFESLCENK